MRAEISYFSPAEFGILMALTGTTPYCAITGGPPCTVEDYRRAYGSLYQRGYLERTDSGFALADLGNPFRQIRAAKRVLVLTAGDAGGAPKLYYWNGSSGWLVEIMPKGQTKAAAIGFLSEYYHIPREEIAAIGDQENDLPMLAEAGGKFAVANGVDALLRIAQKVPSNEEDGVAYAIEHYVL